MAQTTSESVDVRPVSIEADGEVVVLRLIDHDNRFNRRSLDAINAGLDRIDDTQDPKALVVVGTGKFFSNGLDLDWLGTGEEDMVGFIADVMAMWARILAAPYPTVAAVNGHAFAGGAMFALAFDQRVMRVDRGFWCVNELLLGMDLPPGMAAIVQAKLPAPVAHKAVTTAHRFSADEALRAGFVDATADETTVLPVAIERAAALTATSGPTLGALKRRLYGPTIALLEDGARP